MCENLMYNYRGNGGGKISTVSKHSENCFLSQVTQGLEIQCTCVGWLNQFKVFFVSPYVTQYQVCA